MTQAETDVVVVEVSSARNVKAVAASDTAVDEAVEEEAVVAASEASSIWRRIYNLQ